MNTQINPSTVKKTARTAGFLYLILAICGGFAEFGVRQALVVPGNAAETFSNIAANIGTFRIGFLMELVGQAAFVWLVLALYRLLKPVDRKQAVLMVSLVLVAVTITCLNMLNQFAALMLVEGVEYLAVFPAGQIEAMVLFFMDLQHAGYIIAQVFFGLWLLPLGILVYRSGFMPKLIGSLLVVACAGYLADIITFVLMPDFGLVLSEFTFIGELLIMVWLLVKGVNTEQWLKRAGELAPSAASAA